MSGNFIRKVIEFIRDFGKNLKNLNMQVRINSLMTLEASEGMQDKTIFIFELDTKKQFFIFYKSASREISTIQKPIKEDARRIRKVVSVFQEC